MFKKSNEKVTDVHFLLQVPKMTQNSETSGRKAKRPWIGEWLIAYLNKNGQNQDVLAIRWGYTASMVNKILKGKADLGSQHWPDLAGLLGISVDQVVRGSTDVEQGSIVEGRALLAPKPTARDLADADRFLDELVTREKFDREERFEWLHWLSETISEKRALNLPEAEIEKRVRHLVALARRHRARSKGGR